MVSFEKTYNEQNKLSSFFTNYSINHLKLNYTMEDAKEAPDIAPGLKKWISESE